MKLAGGVLLGACATGVFLLSALQTAGAVAHQSDGKEPARATTDGRLRPGHLETVHVSGFPGKGVIEVSFFPTAICEDECGGRSFRGGRTDARGAATFRVRVPGTFIDQRNRAAYFRDGERIDVEVVWEGPGNSFDGTSVDPDPIIVRSHGSRHD